MRVCRGGDTGGRLCTQAGGRRANMGRAGDAPPERGTYPEAKNLQEGERLPVGGFCELLFVGIPRLRLHGGGP